MGPGSAMGHMGATMLTKVVKWKLLKESFKSSYQRANNLMRIMKRLKFEEVCKLLTSELWFNQKLNCTLSISRFIHEHLPTFPHQMKPSSVWESFPKVYIKTHQILSRSSGKQNLRFPNGSDNDARAWWINVHASDLNTQAHESSFQSDDANRKKKSALKVVRRSLISKWIELWRRKMNFDNIKLNIKMDTWGSFPMFLWKIV